MVSISNHKCIPRIEMHQVETATKLRGIEKGTTVLQCPHTPHTYHTHTPQRMQRVTEARRHRTRRAQSERGGGQRENDGGR